jgi:hypothetical protein
MQPEIVVRDKLILDFYQRNPHLDFLTMNHILIDILNKLSTDLTETVQNTLHSQILTTLSSLSHDVHSLKQDLSLVSQEWAHKFNLSKKDYIEDIKSILSQSSLSDMEKTQTLMDKNSEWVLTKTNLLLQEVVPKNHEKFYQQIESCIRQLHTSLNAETQKIMEHTTQDDKALKSHFENIDLQFNKMFSHLQQQVFTFLQSNQDHNQSHLKKIHEKLSTQDTLSQDLNVFLNKYKYNSSVKGAVSESELYSVLQKIFPHDNILDRRGETAACDYEVRRLNENLPTILFENKDYLRSTTTDEVEKFERDLRERKHHGIFISQNSPITFKKPFQIDIIEGIVHVYLPNLHYNEEKIQIAVHMIDSLSQQVSVLETFRNHPDQAIFMSEKDIDDLVKDYTEFLNQKTSIVDLSKQSHKKIIEQLDELQLPILKRFLTQHRSFQETELRCPHCSTFTGKNKGSISAHARSCRMNPRNATQPRGASITVDL